LGRPALLREFHGLIDRENKPDELWAQLSNYSDLLYPLDKARANWERRVQFARSYARNAKLNGAIESKLYFTPDCKDEELVAFVIEKITKEKYEKNDFRTKSSTQYRFARSDDNNKDQKKSWNKDQKNKTWDKTHKKKTFGAMDLETEKSAKSNKRYFRTKA
jgi:hypothetical protein